MDNNQIPIKYIDLNEIKSGGYLLAINHFLHRHGMALHLSVDGEGNVVGIIGFADLRQQPGGPSFPDSELTEPKRELFARLQGRLSQRDVERARVHGWVEQPIVEESPTKAVAAEDEEKWIS